MTRWVVAAGLFVAACASAPRPRVLSDVDAARQSPTVKEAERAAPQAHARAEALRAEALRAHEEDDPAGAQILGEHALAAYEHAGVLARLGEAERALGDARAKLVAARAELADLDEQQKRLAADADAAELALKVALDAVPLVPNAPTGPERERARLEAARAISTQARLTCLAARMLDPKAEAVRTELGKLDALDEQLARSPEATPIDEAMRARSACLRALTATRRAATAHAATSTTDVLLSELGRGGHSPIRDDRGVVVTLRSVVHRGGLSPTAEQSLTTLAAVSKANPAFPILVVAHSGKGAAARDAAELVAARLRELGAGAVESRDAGSWLPVADPARRESEARNVRIEVVFVSPH